MTEEQAKTKLCPKGRFIYTDLKCIASACMLLIPDTTWENQNKGDCGLKRRDK